MACNIKMRGSPRLEIREVWPPASPGGSPALSMARQDLPLLQGCWAGVAAVAAQPGNAMFQCSYAGDLPKQIKLKKLAKLKTLDTKPGEPARGQLASECLLRSPFPQLPRC